MPEPSAPPPEPAARDIPENLDELIAEAMRRGSTAKLAAALKGSGGASSPASERPTPTRTPTPATRPRPATRPKPTPASTPGPAPTPTPSLSERPTSAPEASAPPSAPSTPSAAPPPPASPDEALAALSPTLQEAQSAWSRQEPEATREALRRLVLLAQGALAALPSPTPEAPAAPPLSFRIKAALVIDGPGDAELAKPLAEALGVDFATARLIAISRPLKIAARAEVAAELEERAARVRARTSLQASVLTRAQLEAAPTPEVLLSRDGAAWTTTRAPAWRMEPDQVRALSGEVRGPAPATLAVQGEVVLRRYRQSSGASRYGRKRDAKLEKASERRLGVLDLHGPGLFLRVIEGVSEVGDPTQRSSRLRFRGFCEALEGELPGLRLEPRRICRAPELLSVPDGHDPGLPLETTGWAEFEEHTRLARLHVLGAAEGSG